MPKVAAMVTERYCWAYMALSLLKCECSGLCIELLSGGIRAGVRGCRRLRLYLAGWSWGEPRYRSGDDQPGVVWFVWNAVVLFVSNFRNTWTAEVGIMDCVWYIRELLKSDCGNCWKDVVAVSCCLALRWVGINLLPGRCSFPGSKPIGLWRQLELAQF